MCLFGVWVLFRRCLFFFFLSFSRPLSFCLFLLLRRFSSCAAVVFVVLIASAVSVRSLLSFILCSKVEIWVCRVVVVCLWWIFKSFRSWICVLWMTSFHLSLSFLSASSACSDVLICRPCGVGLFHSALFTNCRCEWCLACFSFSVLSSFRVVECIKVSREVGSPSGNA